MKSPVHGGVDSKGALDEKQLPREQGILKP